MTLGSAKPGDGVAVEYLDQLSPISFTSANTDEVVVSIFATLDDWRLLNEISVRAIVDLDLI